VSDHSDIANTLLIIHQPSDLRDLSELWHFATCFDAYARSTVV
jgi:hypothetical protein